MSESTVDCRGLPCPQPVIRLKRLLEESSPERLLVIVDNDPALENVSRFLASKGYGTAPVADSGLWRVTATRGEGTAESVPSTAASEGMCEILSRGDGLRTLVLIITPVFGVGDDTLGIKLMKNFLATLPEFGDELWRIVLLNGGVTLAVEDSPVIGELKALEDSGVSILVCGTCLDHFKLLEKKAVGETTNMLDVVTSIQLAEKVVRV